MKILILSMTFFLFFGQIGFAQEIKKGWLREKLKDRWIKNQQEKDAPEANSDFKKIEAAGTSTFTFPHQGINRYYKIHVPVKYKATSPAPLLFAFHGGGGNMKIQSEDKFYKQISKSEKEGFVVVFPNGFSKLKSGEFATWNAGKCCGDARDSKSDDVGFIKEVLSRVKQQVNIDEKRIYATGMSNGAMMSYRLACELPEVFRAIAAVAGTDGTEQCAPSKAVSILHVHARNDDHVKFTGGAGSKAAEESKITDFTSVPDTIAKWVKENKCDSNPKRILEKAGAYCEEYTKCKDGTKVQLCVTESGGHSWPGGKKPRGKDETSKSLSANDVMWDFFSSL